MCSPNISFSTATIALRLVWRGKGPLLRLCLCLLVLHIGAPTVCPKHTRTQSFYFTFSDFTRAESVVGVLIMLYSDNVDVMLQFQAGRSHTSCYHSVQKECFFLVIWYGGFFPGQSGRGLKPITQIHQFARLKMSGAAVPIHPHVFVRCTWTLSPSDVIHFTIFCHLMHWHFFGGEISVKLLKAEDDVWFLNIFHLSFARIVYNHCRWVAVALRLCFVSIFYFGGHCYTTCLYRRSEIRW